MLRRAELGGLLLCAMVVTACGSLHRYEYPKNDVLYRTDELEPLRASALQRSNLESQREQILEKLLEVLKTAAPAIVDLAPFVYQAYKLAVSNPNVTNSVATILAAVNTFKTYYVQAATDNVRSEDNTETPDCTTSGLEKSEDYQAVTFRSEPSEASNKEISARNDKSAGKRENYLKKSVREYAKLGDSLANDLLKLLKKRSDDKKSVNALLRELAARSE